MIPDMKKTLAGAKAFMLAHAVPSIPGSIPAGRRVSKATFELGDGNPVGALGTVLAVMPIRVEGECGYFVEWDRYPGIPVFTRGSKIKEVDA